MRNANLAWLAAGLLLLGALPAAAAEPSFTEENDRLVLANGNIEVAFQGKKPLLQVRDATDPSRGYQVFLQRLVEMPPGAEVAGAREVASLDLAGAEAWNVTHERTGDGITLTLRREGPIRLQPGTQQGLPVPPDVQNLTGNRTTGDASVAIVFHIAERTRQLQAGNHTFNVTAHEVKFDLVVERWDWASRADVLGLEFVLAGGQGNASLSRTAVNASANRVVALGPDGREVGFVSWLPMAMATFNGTAREAAVEHRPQGSGQGRDPAEPEGARHLLVYRAPGFDRLEHDPSVGVVPAEGQAAPPPGGSPGTQDAARTPGPGLALLLLAAPAAAALAARRRA